MRAVVKVAPVAQQAPRAGGRWHTFDLIVRASRRVVVLNGRTTVDAADSKFASGPVALQWRRGTVKFRSVRIRPI